MKNPRILVSAPISDLKLYCFEEFMHALSFLTYKNKEILLIETDGDDYMQSLIRSFKFKCETLNSNKKMMDKVVDARNYIRQYALDKGFDYVLMLDADIILSENIIEVLLKHNKDFVSATAFGMNNIGFPELVAVADDGKHFPVDKLETGLQKIFISGMGCALISKKVLKKVKFKCLRNNNDKVTMSEDWCFSQDAIKKDFEIWLDTDIQVTHKIRGDWIWENA